MKHFVKRAIAYFLDCLICYVLIMLIIQKGLISNLSEMIGLTDAWFENSINLYLYVLLTISLPVWFYFTYFDSKMSKGTFGKRIMKLTVVTNSRERMDLKTSFLRTILKLSPWEILHIGVIFPTPLYFSQSSEIRPAMIVGIILFGIYMISLIINTNGQSIYDKLLGTTVIKK